MFNDATTTLDRPTHPGALNSVTGMIEDNQSGILTTTTRPDRDAKAQTHQELVQSHASRESDRLQLVVDGYSTTKTHDEYEEYLKGKRFRTLSPNSTYWDIQMRENMKIPRQIVPSYKGRNYVLDKDTNSFRWTDQYMSDP